MVEWPEQKESGCISGPEYWCFTLRSGVGTNIYSHDEKDEFFTDVGAVVSNILNCALNKDEIKALHFDLTIPLVSIDAELKGISGNDLHQLGKNRLANIHGLHPNCSGKQS